MLRAEGKKMFEQHPDRAKGCYTAAVSLARQMAKQGGLLAEEATEMEHGCLTKLAEIASRRERDDEATHNLLALANTLPSSLVS